MSDEMLMWLSGARYCLRMVQLMPLPSQNPIISSSLKSGLVLPSGIGLSRLPWKRGCNRCNSSWSCWRSCGTMKAFFLRQIPHCENWIHLVENNPHSAVYILYIYKWWTIRHHYFDGTQAGLTAVFQVTLGETVAHRSWMVISAEFV